MLVGMPFSGKTTALNTLQKALTDLAQDMSDMTDDWVAGFFGGVLARG